MLLCLFVFLLLDTLLLLIANQRWPGQCSLVLMNLTWKLCLMSPSFIEETCLHSQMDNKKVEECTLFLSLPLTAMTATSIYLQLYKIQSVRTMEKSFKKIIEITLICYSLFSTLSAKTIRGDWQYTTFYPTPKMSTYLFAFTVSEFTSIKSTTHNDVKIYVCITHWECCIHQGRSFKEKYNMYPILMSTICRLHDNVAWLF